MSGTVLLDSHGWIEYFSDGPLADKYARYVEQAHPDTHVTPTIVLFEVYKKIKRDKGEEIALRDVAYIVNRTTVVPIDLNIALNGADISIALKLSTADAVIKAVAERTGAQLVTGDEHFKGLDQVTLIG